MTQAMVGHSAYAVGQWPGESAWLELQANNPDAPIPDYQPTVAGAGGAVIGYVLGKSLMGGLLGAAAGVVGYLAYDAYQRTGSGWPDNWKNPIRPRTAQ